MAIDQNWPTMTTWHTVSQLILPVTINQTQAYGHVPPLISWPSPPNGHWSALAYSHSVKSQQGPPKRFVVTSVLSLRQMRALLLVDPTSEMTAANVQC
ncbi:unnamed protein product [Sphagnum troendelagicum]|uniref:Uncharacterized protein n=1 Tax=Sphagnum troendelagicum TaxID=128251 RepID=A0ABP0T9K8_9BRYO